MFEVTVTFDQALQANPAAPGTDWTARHNNTAMSNPTVVVSGNDEVVLSAWTTLGPDPGPDLITYTNTVDALLGMGGLPVATFADFPVT